MMARRLLTVPAYAIAGTLWLASAPLWIVAALSIDLVRGRDLVTLRAFAVVSAYLACETIGVLISGALWLWRAIGRIDDTGWRDVHYRLEAWWGTTIFRAVVRAFDMRIEVDDTADLGRGPYLLLVRHASTADTLLAAALVQGPYGMRLRYVLKRELLFDPCLDIVGHRVPNVFVDREAADSEAEIRAIGELARGLGARDGVLIYPEGTRFSPDKQQRVIAALTRRGDAKMIDYAQSLRHVLPPRPGGTLALLDAAPKADVVVCAHTGFEGTASLADVWRGRLLRRTIRVRFTRIPRASIPDLTEQRADWLRGTWRETDAWIDARRAATAELLR